MLESTYLAMCYEKISFVQVKLREKNCFYDLSSSTPRTYSDIIKKKEQLYTSGIGRCGGWIQK